MIINGLAHYTQHWVNRRSRKAILSSRTALYHYYYRSSWSRYQKYFDEVLTATFGVPIFKGEASEAITIVGPTP